MKICLVTTLTTSEKIGSQGLHVATTEFNIKNWHSCVTRFHITCVKWVIPKISTPFRQMARFFLPISRPDFLVSWTGPLLHEFPSQRCPRPLGCH